MDAYFNLVYTETSPFTSKTDSGTEVPIPTFPSALTMRREVLADLKFAIALEDDTLATFTPSQRLFEFIPSIQAAYSESACPRRTSKDALAS